MVSILSAGENFDTYLGSLGDGFNVSSASPVKVLMPPSRAGTENPSWVSLSNGCAFTCGVDSNGRGMCLGDSKFA